MRGYSGSLTGAVIAAIIATIIIIFIGIWLVAEALGADAALPCLTKAQAQAKWPGQWLYWHTVNKCWDNINTRQGKAVGRAQVRYSVSRNPMQLGKPPIDPSGNPVHHSGRPIIGPTIAYPTLMPGGGTADAMLHPEAMTTWPLVADFDEDPPQFIPWQQRIAFFVAR